MIRPRTRPLGRVALLLGTVLLAAGCSQSPPPGDVAYLPDPGGGMDALTTGTLRLLDGCLYLETQDPGAAGRSVPVFPNRGIRWDGDTLRVGSESFPLGAEIDLGGGESGTVPPTAVVPDACDTTTYWVVNLG